jgi:hypothetical protein
VQSVSRTFSLPRRGRQVIEADLNCSELASARRRTLRPSGSTGPGRAGRGAEGNARSRAAKLFIPDGIAAVDQDLDRPRMAVRCRHCP